MKRAPARIGPKIRPARTRSPRFVRCLSGASALLALLLATGCTTSRAQLSWEAGRAAEAKGQRDVAMRRYQEAYSLRDHLVGAELDRIRLLAEVPDRKPQAQEALETLLKKRGGLPEVATFGAAWALRHGDARRARERLDPARKVTLARPGCDPVVRAFLGVDLAAEVGEGRQAPAAAARDRLAQRCGPEAVDPGLGALVAFNGGDLARARRALARLPQGDRSLPLLRAALALHAGQHADAAAALGVIADSDLGPLALVLRGQAAFGQGHFESALADGRAALRLRPGMEAAEQLLGLARLAQGDARAARDLLAGIAARSPEQVHWTVLFDLGVAEVKLGDLAAAASRFEQAARRCPECAPAKANAEALAKLQR